MGSISNVASMDYHGNAIPPCSISIIGINKGLVKLPFPNLEGTKLKDAKNGVVLCEISELTISK